MNKCTHIGRLTKDPEIRGGQNNNKVAKFTLAVDRKYKNKKEGEPSADFINMTAFGKTADFVEKYLHKGSKIATVSAFQNNNYKGRDGNTVYSYQFIIIEIEFVESKAAEAKNGPVNDSAPKTELPAKDDFMAVPDSISEELPFG